jgi:RNA-directed DNA polymerase
MVTGKLVRYADDFVIMFKTKEEAELGLRLVKAKLKELGLELNEEKTKIVDTSGGKQGFDFLGFHHRRVMSRKYRRFYTQRWPSNKSMRSIRATVKSFLGSRSILRWDIEDVVRVINPMLRGWMNYFKYGNSSKKFKKMDRYVHERMALWWSKKHQKPGRRWKVDFTYGKFNNCGVQILRGSIQYGSCHSSNAH